MKRSGVLGRTVFEWLIVIYPAPFRARYGAELRAFFESDRDRAGEAGWPERVGFWARTLSDLVQVALRLRFRGLMARMGGVAGGTPLDRPAPGSGIVGAAGGGRDPRGRSSWSFGHVIGAWVRAVLLAVRSLSRQPTYAVAGVITLAVGIGASTSIFSVADAVLLRPLPYPDAGSLVALGAMRPDGRVGGLSAPNAWDIEASALSLSSLSLSRVGTLDITGDGEPERLIGAAVSPSYFEQLGVRAEQGRLLRPQDDTPGVARVGVISHGLWMRRWNGDVSVVGRTFSMNDAPMTVVGIATEGFVGPEGLGQSSVEVWYPVAFVERGENPLFNRGDQFLTVLARLSPGATLETATTEVETLGGVLAAEYPADNGKGGAFDLGVVSLRESTLGDVRSRLALFGGAVFLLFLAALSNGASLMLGRFAQREREMAVRRALGAGRARILGQVLAESAVVTTMACGLGVVLAVAGIAVFERLQPGAVPRADGIGINVRVLGFAVLAAVATSLVVGLVPGLLATRTRAASALRSGVRATVGASGGRVRRLLVVAETGLALMLLAGAGLLMNSFVRLSSVPLGFETEGVVTMEVFVGGWQSTSEERISVYRRLMAELSALPPIQDASVTTDLPLGVSKLAPVFAQNGRAPADGATRTAAGFHYVAPRYFATLGIPLLPGGRDLTDRDVDEQADVAIINRALALELFGREDAVGERLRIGSLNGTQPWLTIVGVVGDVRHQGLDVGRDFEIYVAHSGGFIGPPLNVLIRSDLALDQLVPMLRSVVGRADPDLPIGRIAPLADRVRIAVATPRFHAMLIALFALSAVAIAVTGLYGALAHAVGQRTREIGVRVALGARTGQVIGLVLRGGMALSFIGIAIGLAGAILAGRALAGLLFGITPTDLPTLLGVAALMAFVQLIACLVPARRAALLPVARTLRADAD